MIKKSHAAFLLNVQELGVKLYFWTFTFRWQIDVDAARKEWGRLLKRFRKAELSLQGLRVYEMHKTHGIHVHLVTTRYLRVEAVRAVTFAGRRSKWGRIHVEKARPSIAKYLGKYLSKPRPAALKYWRLWAPLDKKSFEVTRVIDVFVDSVYGRCWRAISLALGWKGNGAFRQRKEVVTELVRMTAEFGWEAGYIGRGEERRLYTFDLLYEHDMFPRRLSASSTHVSSGGGLVPFLRSTIETEIPVGCKIA